MPAENIPLRTEKYTRAQVSRLPLESGGTLGETRPAMRAVQILGAILIAGGLYVLIKAPTYSSDKSLFKVGQVEAKLQQDHEIPSWVGGVALAAGVVLVVAGVRRG
jgi:hypothetical protein